ncbi:MULTISPECIES: tRNA (5-methylaminomethyl-2-thiouridine)(34)-methyltransferase MnmD [Gracilimonas]|uniref:tRNA (5-methylaminomethyl-2-thiouridine)(34)-methyltransferase MnmD n=1 Tax=Gracilimonas sediminicola TaxID=2952158 RepID=A0A9X2L4U2_9BACT|nr:tRNA (5-methylaminomethyl-2-thiouridine)(34)-methyltransferase MnmD [Gracilimonas sediminicola]MCP9292381.1 tRNA (5-methylaminomethyl-2-thiouridine)(34)-methyltransferase MnmD [Gracilimonas sediminicola]
MTPKVHQTKDGSSTLYSDSFEQFYHNPNGAASESLHVFFETPGLLSYLDTADSLTILEIGFGTGLNFLLLLDILKQKELNIPVEFWSVEAFPVDRSTSSEFNFKEHLKHPELNDLLPGIFDGLKPGLNKLHPLPGLSATLNLFYGKFEDFSPENVQADFIFHDPFSPEVNEELWTGHTFERLASYSKKEAVLATYCAASKARGAMCAAGWKVARSQGALGKREMTVASLTPEPLTAFKRVNEERLAERYNTGDFD